MENVVIKAVIVKYRASICAFLPSLSCVVFGFLSDTNMLPHTQEFLWPTLMTLQMRFLRVLLSVDSDRL